MDYFNLLPTIEYNGIKIRNILKNYQIVNVINEDTLQDYFISSTTTLDKISYELYNDSNLWWLIALINDIKDIFYDIPVSDEVLSDIATTKAKIYPEEIRQDKFFEFYDLLVADNDKKRIIKVINPDYISDALTIINEEIKDEKEKLIELETKKKILFTLDEFKNYYDKALIDGKIDASEQLVLGSYIDSLFYEFLSIQSNYSSLVGNEIYDEFEIKWNELNIAWVNLQSDWGNLTYISNFESAVNAYSVALSELKIELPKYEDDILKNNFINGENGYVLDLDKHKINGVPFADYVFASNGLNIWSGTEAEKDVMNITTNPQLEEDDMFVTSDTLKEYSWNGSQWIELLNADYAQALADVDGKRSIYSTLPSSYKENDLLIPNQDIFYINKIFRAQEIYRAIADSDVFDEDQWEYGLGAIDGISIEAYKENLIDTLENDSTAESLLTQYLESQNIRNLTTEIEQNAVETMNIAISQADDGIMSAAEKSYWRTKWIEIDANYTKVILNAFDIGLSSDITYTNTISAKTALYDYLVSIEVWSNVDEGTIIIAIDLTSAIESYYNSIQILINKVSDYEVTRRNLDSDGNFTGTIFGVSSETIKINAADAIQATIDMSSDAILSPVEKQTWRTKWKEIESNYDEIIANSVSIGFNSNVAYTNVVNSFSSLETYLTTAGVWSSPTTNYTISGTAFTDKVSDYYAKLQILINKVSDYEVTRRNLDSDGNFTGTIFGVDADVVKDNAASAIQSALDVSNDLLLTPSEKQTWRNEWDAISANYTQMINYATSIGISGTIVVDNCATSKTTLYNYLVSAGVWSSPTTNYTIDGSTFTDNVTDYYDKLQLLVNGINDRITYNISNGNVDLSNASVNGITLDSLKQQTDNKISVYVQEGNPSWSDDNINHVDDQWYIPSSMIWYKYDGSSWSINDSSILNIDNLAKGKSTIHYGSSTPLNTLGIDGDYYVKELNDKYTYYKKSSGSWIESGTFENGADVTATSNFVSVTYPTDKTDLQNQIDGKIDTWYTATDPAGSWSGTNASHSGDMWWNTTTKKLKRYSGSAWSADLTDQKAIDAFTNAATAQDTADGKRRVFVSEPTAPYEIGDLWDRGSALGIWRCNTNLTIGGTYSLTHWQNIANDTKTAIESGIEVTQGSTQFSGTGVIKSSNYINGSQGWQIDGLGNAEFNDATIRGTLNADDITTGTLDASQIAVTNLSANSLTSGTIDTSSISISDSSSSSRIEFSGSSIRVYDAGILRVKIGAL